MTAKVTFTRVKSLLAPDGEVDAGLGKNISNNQPDVEVLALALKRVPCTRESFEKNKAADKDWICLQFYVVAVGPPGFSSAPYLSTKKKGEKDKETKPLYEATSNGTLFYPFDKGRTGKDRGNRVDHVDGMTLTATIQPGVCLTKFLRNENDVFEEGRFFMNTKTDVIEENSFVYLQVGTTNAEQAAAGRLLKVKRVMPVEERHVVSRHLMGLPRSMEDHDLVMTQSRDSFPSISKCTIISGHKVFCYKPEPVAYVTQEGEGGLLVNEGKSFTISARVLAECSFASNSVRTRKLLNLALAMDAVTFLVRTSQLDNETSAGEVLHFEVDVNRMLLCRSINEYDTWPDEDSTRLQLQYDVASNCVMWTDPTKALVLPGDAESQLLFELSLKVRRQEEASCAKAAKVVSDGCAGDFYPLRVYTAPAGTFDEICANKTLVMSLQLRPSLRNCGGVGVKRKREAVEADEQDEVGED